MVRDVRVIQAELLESWQCLQVFERLIGDRNVIESEGFQGADRRQRCNPFFGEPDTSDGQALQLWKLREQDEAFIAEPAIRQVQFAQALDRGQPGHTGIFDVDAVQVENRQGRQTG